MMAMDHYGIQLNISRASDSALRSAVKIETTSCAKAWRFDAGEDDTME